MSSLIAAIGLGAGPVVLLLVALLSLDSYKLVRLPAVLRAVALGAATALVCLLVHRALTAGLEVTLPVYARWISPIVEESAKAAIVLWLARTHRVAFLVDAAIQGFAVGTGFAVVENVEFWLRSPDASLAVWLARGAGTALMHSGATGLVGLAAVSTRGQGLTPGVALASLLPAIALHAVYNHFLVSPLLSAAAMVLLLPPLTLALFKRGERALADWLELGFDADTETLELILSGRVSGSPVGTYLEALRRRFRGEVVVDLLNYLRLHLELSVAAKGLLLMREAGFDPPADPEVRHKIEELAWLEASIGPTGRLAMAPFLRQGGPEIWQRHLLRATR